jgi:hypothetical protein
MIRQYNMEIISSEQQSINIQDGLFVRKTAKKRNPMLYNVLRKYSKYVR